jgi:predicted anti-sigma-YlaC factor YlaD
MECLTNFKIQEYVDGSLNGVENAMVRDHLIVCPACQAQHERYEQLESQLFMPVEMLPPALIQRRVMNHLFPKLPTYSSIIALIAASFLLLITGIYIYFDFANNSIVQALQLTSSNTSNWIASIITFISSVFTGVYTVFKAMNRFLDIVFQVNLGAEIIGLSIFLLFSGVFYSIFKVALKRIKT